MAFIIFYNIQFGGGLLEMSAAQIIANFIKRMGKWIFSIHAANAI